MISTPEVEQIEPIQAATIHFAIPRSEIRDVMGPGLQELMGTVNELGIGPMGPWFTHHRRMMPETFDFEICVPVSGPFEPVGRVKPMLFPAMKVAKTTYSGEFEGLGDAWGEFDAWIQSHGYTKSSDLFERYLVGPESSSNPEDWRTELIQPLEGAN